MCCSNSTAKSFVSVDREEDHDQYYRCPLQRSKLDSQMVEDGDFPYNVKHIHYLDLEGENGHESQQDKKKKKKKKKKTTKNCSIGSSGCEGLQQRMRILHSLVHSNSSSCSSSSSSCSSCCCSKPSSCPLNPDDEECILDETISYLKQLQRQVGFISNSWMNSNNNTYYLNMTIMTNSSMLQPHQQQQQQLLPTTTTHAEDLIDKKSNKNDFTIPRT